MDKNISFTLKVWRQKGPKAKGAFETYQMKDIPGDTSFLEMLDILNEQIINDGGEPIVFDHVFSLHQRTPARTCDRCYYLPDVYASLQRWRHHHS